MIVRAQPLKRDRGDHVTSHVAATSYEGPHVQLKQRELAPLAAKLAGYVLSDGDRETLAELQRRVHVALASSPVFLEPDE